MTAKKFEGGLKFPKSAGPPLKLVLYVEMRGFISYFKLYVTWLIGLVIATYFAKHLNEVIAVLLLLACIIVPSDRVRVKMIKLGRNIPVRREAWLYIFSFSFVPFTFGVYSAATAELDEGQIRGGVVVLSIVFWGAFTFGLNALFFLNKTMWSRSKQGITKP